jgi:DNA polymerase
MSLDLDARQRAMLAEMQVPVWWPAAEVPVAAAPTPARAAPPVAVAAPAPEAPAPARSGMHSLAEVMQNAPELIAARAGITSAGAGKDSESSGADLGDADMAALRAAWSACQASRALGAAVGASPDWLVLGEALAISDDPASAPFVGDAGVLLDNMLRAVGIRAQAPLRSAQLTSVLKMRPAEQPDADPLAFNAPYLERHVRLLQPRLILALGPFAAQLLLRDATPLGQLRGRVHRYQEVPVVVSYAPATLLRNPAEKAKAWADLCLAMSASA